MTETWLLGQLLSAGRKDRRLSQTAAAAASGLSRSVWQQLEQGYRYDGKPLRPKPSTVLDAAHAVGVDPAAALSAAGFDPSAVPMPRAGRPRASVREISDLVDRLSEAQRFALREFLLSMLAENNADGPS